MADIVKKKVAVIGSRDFNDKKLLYDTLTRNYDRIKLVISGGARGADTLATQWAADYGIPYLVFPAMWRDPFTGVHDKGAGFRRNRQIVEQCDALIAFWDGKSRGTAHSLEMAKELAKTVKIINFSRPTAAEQIEATRGSICCSSPICEHQDSESYEHVKKQIEAGYPYHQDPGERVAADIHAQMDAANQRPEIKQVFANEFDTL